MFDVIEFLEQVGQDADQRYASAAMREMALADVQLDPTVREAIIGGDQLALRDLLGQGPFCCLISPGKQDDAEEKCDGNCKEGDDRKKDENEKDDNDDRKRSKP